MTLNEGLISLGCEDTNERYNDYLGVFEESGVKNVSLPSTLRILENNTFKCCADLREVQLPERL